MSDTSVSTESTSASIEREPATVPVEPAQVEAIKERPALDPTRYGDWEKNGRCIDF